MSVALRHTASFQYFRLHKKDQGSFHRSKTVVSIGQSPWVGHQERLLATGDQSSLLKLICLSLLCGGSVVPSSTWLLCFPWWLPTPRCNGPPPQDRWVMRGVLLPWDGWAAWYTTWCVHTENETVTWLEDFVVVVTILSMFLFWKKITLQT